MFVMLGLNNTHVMAGLRAGHPWFSRTGLRNGWPGVG